MRIAYLINQYPKVSHSFIRREILALEQLGFEIMRISLRGWDLELADEEDRRERERTRYVLRANWTTLLLAAGRMAVTRPIRLAAAMVSAWRMSRGSQRPLYVHYAYVAEACHIEPWLRTARVKHLHAHFGTNSAEVALLVHVLGGPPFSFTIHGPQAFMEAGPLHLAEKIQSAEFTALVCHFGRSQLLLAIDPQDWAKLHVVHCGLDLTFLNVPNTTAALPKRIVCVARLSREKGHTVLLSAVRVLATQGLDFQLILAGDGELRPEIEAQIARDNLGDKVHLTGWLSSEQVRDEILAARALVLPSFAEGLPVVIMEAMALRRPVISTFVAGIPELVRPGKDGWLVPPGDLESLVEALRNCLESPVELIAQMGEEAHERVLVRHNAMTEAKKLQQLFHLGQNDQKSS